MNFVTAFLDGLSVICPMQGCSRVTGGQIRGWPPLFRSNAAAGVLIQVNQLGLRKGRSITQLC